MTKPLWNKKNKNDTYEHEIYQLCQSKTIQYNKSEVTVDFWKLINEFDYYDKSIH